MVIKLLIQVITIKNISKKRLNNLNKELQFLEKFIKNTKKQVGRRGSLRRSFSKPGAAWGLKRKLTFSLKSIFKGFLNDLNII